MDYQAYVPPKRIFIYIRSAAARSTCLFAAPLPAGPAPAELTQQSSHLSGPQSANPAQLEHQPAPICLQHGTSRTVSPVYVPQQHGPSSLTPQRLPRRVLKSLITSRGTGSPEAK
ncbi:hypothetical protein Tco_1014976 [Tanacetum coccineum]